MDSWAAPLPLLKVMTAIFFCSASFYSYRYLFFVCIAIYMITFIWFSNIWKLYIWHTCFSRIIKRWWTRWRKARRRRTEVQEIEAARLHREANERDLPESLMCVVCCGLRDVLLLPCQHVCVCGECSLRLDPRKCPVCRTPIERIQPIFYPWYVSIYIFI